MHGLGKPYPLLLQAKGHVACLVGACRHLCCRIRAVHCYDQCVGKRPTLVGQSHWQILSGAQGVRILLRDQFQGEAHRLIALGGGWRSVIHQTFRAARKDLARIAVGLVPARSQLGDRIEPFFPEVLVEGVGRQHNWFRMTLIADDEQSCLSDMDEAGRIRAVAAVYWFAACRIDADELIDECGIAGERVSQKVLPYPQSQPDDLSGVSEKGSGLDSYVVSGQRRCADEQGGNETKDIHATLLFWSYDLC